MPVRLGDARIGGNRELGVAASDDVFLEAREHDGRRGRRRVRAPAASASAAAEILPGDLRQRARRVVREAVELDLLDGDLGRAAVRDHERHADCPVRARRSRRWPAPRREPRWRQSAPAGTRVPSAAGGTRFRYRALSSIGMLRSWLAHHADRAEAGHERLHHRHIVALGVELLLRRLNRGGHRVEAVGQGLGRLGAGKLRERRDRRVDAVGQRALVLLQLTRDRALGQLVIPRRRSRAAPAAAPCPGTCACCALRCRCPE